MALAAPKPVGRDLSFSGRRLNTGQICDTLKRRQQSMDGLVRLKAWYQVSPLNRIKVSHRSHLGDRRLGVSLTHVKLHRWTIGSIETTESWLGLYPLPNSGLPSYRHLKIRASSFGRQSWGKWSPDCGELKRTCHIRAPPPDLSRMDLSKRRNADLCTSKKRGAQTPYSAVH